MPLYNPRAIYSIKNFWSQQGQVNCLDPKWLLFKAITHSTNNMTEFYS